MTGKTTSNLALLNGLLFSGGSAHDADNDDSDLVLSFDIISQTWRTVGRLQNARRDHGISVVDIDDIGSCIFSTGGLTDGLKEYLAGSLAA